jgi:hypothetical protein
MDSTLALEAGREVRFLEGENKRVSNSSGRNQSFKLACGISIIP